MPIINTPQPSGPIQHLVPEEVSDPEIGEIFGAAFRNENTLVNWAANGFKTSHSFDPVEGYDPFDDIEGYEPFAENFIDVRSSAEAAHVKQQIDREQEDRKTLSAGGGTAIAMQMAAGITDPVYLPLMLVPGGALIRGAKTSTQVGIRVGALSGASEAVAEGVKQQLQQTRSPLESAINIAGATLLSGVLGSTAHRLLKTDLDNLAAKIDADDGVPRSVWSAETLQASFDDLELVNAGKIEQMGVSPLIRTQTSESVETRRIASTMMESPLITKGNVEGKATIPLGGAVETRIKRWDTNFASSLEQLDKHYLSYRQRVKGMDDVLGRYEFREAVGKAMRRGDQHVISEVAEAAARFRRTLFDPLKDRAIDSGLLPQGVKPKTAVSYLTRVYNHRKIVLDRNKWDQLIKGWVRSSRDDALLREPNSDFAKIENYEIKGIVNAITDQILHSPGGRIAYESVPLPRGPLRERTFLIPDELIEEFLESDIELVSRQFLRTMAPDVELTHAFGDVQLTAELDRIASSYSEKSEKASSQKQRSKIQKALERDQRDISAMRDLLRGLYKVPADPNNFFVRAGKAVRDYNFVRMLGGMTLSAIPDLARPVAVNGLKPVAKGLHQLATSPKRFKLAREEAKRAAVGLDMVLNSRAISMGSLEDMYTRGTKFERTLDAGANMFGKVTLMTQWNAALKQFSGVISADRIVTDSLAWEAGKIAKGARVRLAAAGIDELVAGRIAQQFSAHGDDGTIKLINGQQWDDIEALDAFRSAVLKDVDRTIVTPGKGELPLIMQGSMGKVIFQFKTFAAASHHKILLSDLQYRDASALTGLLLAAALGTLSYGLKQYVAGREVSDDPSKLIVESLDRSGVFGYFWDANNVLEKMTRGHVGVNSALGAPVMSRYMSRNLSGALLGPTADTIEDASRVIGATASREFRSGDVRALRKLLPYQNLFYIRRLLNSIEEEVE